MLVFDMIHMFLLVSSHKGTYIFHNGFYSKNTANIFNFHKVRIHQMICLNQTLSYNTHIHNSSNSGNFMDIGYKQQQKCKSINNSHLCIVCNLKNWMNKFCNFIPRIHHMLNSNLIQNSICIQYKFMVRKGSIYNYYRCISNIDLINRYTLRTINY